jgi:hypothetical protein
MLTFSTVAATAKAETTRGIFYALLLPMPGLLLIGTGFGTRGSRRKKLFGFLLLWIILSGLVMLPACGSSGGNNGGGGGSPGTPAGTYTITIMGNDANGVTQSNTAPTVSVTVN